MSSNADLMAAAERILELARQLGAEECAASVSFGVSTELEQRDGRVEKAQESRSLSADVELLVDGRFTSCGTSDLRPEALAAVLRRAVDAGRHLEPDLDRRLTEAHLLGVADAELDLDDPTVVQPGDRRARVTALEAAARAAAPTDPVRSITAYAWDGRSARALAFSNGFRSARSGTHHGLALTVSLEDADGRLPEAWASSSARHLQDVDSVHQLADEAASHARARLGARPAPSGRYPMLLDRRSVSRVLGALLSPLGGAAIYEGRSCMADRLGARVASTAFTLIDDPLIPRGLGSRAHDGDGLPAQRRVVIEDGVLQMFFIGVYDGRRLGRPPTTESGSNLVVPPGPRSPGQLAAGLGRHLRVDGFLGGSSNPVTGDFSFGVQGALADGAEILHPISEMNVSGNLFELMDRYLEAADDTCTHSAWRCPTLLFDQVQFSGS
jgi:PmbA protein